MLAIFTNYEDTRSSIEHVGTRTFSNVWEFLGGFSLMEIFVRYFLWWGGFILFSLHMTMVWHLANEAGILAPSDAIDVYVSKHQSALIRGDRDSSSTAGPKAWGSRPLSRWAKAVVCVSKQRALCDKQSVLLTVGGVRFWSKERSDVVRNRAMGGQRGP